MKRCPKCKIYRPPSDFNMNRARPDGLQGECRYCQADRGAAQRAIARWRKKERAKREA